MTELFNADESYSAEGQALYERVRRALAPIQAIIERDNIRTRDARAVIDDAVFWMTTSVRAVRNL